jgi:hypothetical protein
MKTNRSWNRTPAVAAALAVATALAVAGPPGALLGQDEPGLLAITRVDVVDVRSGTLVEDRTVVIESGRIRSIEAGAPAPDGARVIDGEGRVLIPGLWDMHVHLRNPLAPTLLMPQFIANGVTGVRDMGGDCEEPSETATCIEQLREWNDRVETGELAGPRILAISSFPLNPPWDYEVTEEEARALVGRLSERGVDLLKVYYRLSPAALGWIVDEARRLGMDVGGHLPLRMTAREASNAGLRSLEHARDFLFDCFPGSAEFRRTAMSQNPPMDVMRSMVDDHDEAQCDETFEAFVRNDTWYVPTHVTRRMDAYADDPGFRDDPRRKYIPASAWASWQADADRMVALDPSPEGRRIVRGFYEKGLEITGRAHDAGVSIVLGTDAGDTYVFPGSGTHDELGELVKAGLSPGEALAAGTVRAAEFLRLEADYGTVEVGKVADLLLLTANPLEDIARTRGIEAVILNGEVRTRADLDELLRVVEGRIAGAGN